MLHSLPYMRLAASFVLLAAAASFGCGGSHPFSPSPLASTAGPGTTLSIGPSDSHEPTPEPTPEPDPGPVPAVTTISIVGSSGTRAFAPNPLEASAGHAVVWTNNDINTHRIVLDDGTILGTIVPGQSFAPVTLSAATVTYRCTIHPSMVGTIQNPAVVSPTPEPAPAPPPDDGDGGYGGYY